MYEHPSFTFVGWFRITRLDILQPRSEALVVMLRKKWSYPDHRTGRMKEKVRSTQAWEDSLRLKWAEIKMELDEKAVKELGPPNVAPLEEKSVNDLLREMRLGKGERRNPADEGGVALN